MGREAHSTGSNPSAQAGRPSTPVAAAGSQRMRHFVLAIFALALVFCVPLGELIYFALTSEFHSYILLIPFISLYLVWLKRPHLSSPGPPARLAAKILLAGGLALVGVYWLALRSRMRLAEDDYLALMMLAFLSCLFGVCCLFWDKNILRSVAFPLSLLIFVVPIPVFAVLHIDSFLQAGSAAVAQVFFDLSGTPSFRNGVSFQLADISIKIAPECSGIQSSLVLLITSLLAGYLFLRTPWKRALLVLFVIPLALLRNGFRVFVIGELCVHIGPQMINSYIHRKGGPIFFVLSLIPLFLLLMILQKSEKGRSKRNSVMPETSHV
jgi:exosortase C (VPDSG-CTERM-specific)